VVAKHRSTERRCFRHGNNGRPASVMTQSGPGEELGQQAAAADLRRGRRWMGQRERSAPTLYTQHGAAGTREVGTGMKTLAREIHDSM
jgi:hypothetical protein